MQIHLYSSFICYFTYFHVKYTEFVLNGKGCIQLPMHRYKDTQQSAIYQETLDSISDTFEYFTGIVPV